MEDLFTKAAPDVDAFRNACPTKKAAKSKKKRKYWGDNSDGEEEKDGGGGAAAAGAGAAARGHDVGTFTLTQRVHARQPPRRIGHTETPHTVKRLRVGGDDDDKDVAVDDLFGTAAVTEVGSVTPVDDFFAMLKQRGGAEDLVAKAIQGLKHQIDRMIDGGTMFLDKALEGLSALRKGALQVMEEDEFNSYLEHLKVNHEGSEVCVVCCLPDVCCA